MTDSILLGLEILVSHTDITTALHGQTFGRNDSLSGMIKASSITVKTTNQGQISFAGFTPENSTILAAYDLASHIYYIHRGSISWNARVTTYTGEIFANATVTVNFKYISHE